MDIKEYITYLLRVVLDGAALLSQLALSAGSTAGGAMGGKDAGLRKGVV